MAVHFPVSVQRMPKFKGRESQLPEKQVISNKPVLVSLDIDGTLIPWTQEPQYDQLAFKRYTQSLNQPEFRKNAFILLNTGRGLSSVQGVSHLLKDFPIDAVGVNDGQQVFLKHQPPEGAADNPQATQAWLSGLTQADESKERKAALNGWSTLDVLSDIRQLLQQQGFSVEMLKSPHNGFTQKLTKPIEGEKNTQWEILFQPDQSYMEMKRSDNKSDKQAISQFAIQLGQSLQKSLQAKWPQFSYINNPLDNRTYLHFSPAGHSKASLASYLAQQFAPKPRAIISAGDSANDQSILAENTLDGIPNFPVMVGNHPELKAHLQAHAPEHLETVGAGQLDAGLTRQFNKIKPTLPLQFGKSRPTQAQNGALLNRLA